MILNTAGGTGDHVIPNYSSEARNLVLQEISCRGLQASEDPKYRSYLSEAPVSLKIRVGSTPDIKSLKRIRVAWACIQCNLRIGVSKVSTNLWVRSKLRESQPAGRSDDILPGSTRKHPMLAVLGFWGLVVSSVTVVTRHEDGVNSTPSTRLMCHHWCTCKLLPCSSILNNHR